MKTISSTLDAVALTSDITDAGRQSEQVKWSAGTDQPDYVLPGLLTDCHHHIYDGRYPSAASATLHPEDALVDDYRLLQKRLGIKRHVIVQASTYGTDNRLLLDALASFGRTTTRGVAVVNHGVTDGELKSMHDAGVRGIRFNFSNPGATTLDMLTPLAHRVAAMGWHVQVNAPATDLLAARHIWSQLPCQIVFDHLGHVPPANALQQPVFAMLVDLLQRNKAWVKLSGFYFETDTGAPAYSDRVQIASAFAQAAPERVVWGSDWPHPTEPNHDKPNDATLLNLIKLCVPDAGQRDLLLVNNPALLYQFE